SPGSAPPHARRPGGDRDASAEPGAGTLDGALPRWPPGPHRGSRSSPCRGALSPSRQSTSTGRTLSFPESPLALLIASDRPQEIDLPKDGPVRIAEVELAIGA